MNIDDIVKYVLEKLDELETSQNNYPEIEPGEQTSRFKHIYNMMDTERKALANTPNEKYAPIDAVTTDAGGGINGPKHPADIRVKDPRGYE